MRLSKDYLNKLVKQEIKRVLYEEYDNHANAIARIAQMRDVIKDKPEDIAARNLIKICIDFIDELDASPIDNADLVSHFHSNIKDAAATLNLSNTDEIINFLKDKMDLQMLSRISDSLNADPNMRRVGNSLSNIERPLDPLEIGRKQGVNINEPGQADAFQRPPPSKETPEDVRAKKKNLVHENIKSINEQDTSGPSQYYGIVMERLKPLSAGEQEELDTLCGLWLDPRVKKIMDLTEFLKQGNYERLIKSAGILGKKLETAKLGELDIEKEKLKNPSLVKKFTQMTAEKILAKNEQLLTKNKLPIDADRLDYLGGGADGHVFLLEDGRALKITSNKEEAAAANKIKDKNLNYIITIYDVFYFTKNQVSINLAEAGQTKIDRFKPATQANVNATSATQAVQKDEKFYENAYRSIAESFNIKEILNTLKAVGLQFSDLHSGNLMKRGGTYVLIDLGYAEGGMQVQKSLAEKKNLLKQLILQAIRYR